MSSPFNWSQEELRQYNPFAPRHPEAPFFCFSSIPGASKAYWKGLKERADVARQWEGLLVDPRSADKDDGE